MSVKVRAKKSTNWAIRIVLVAVAAFLFLKLVQLHTQIGEKQKLIDSANAQNNTLMLLNEDYESQLKNPDACLEKEAYDAGYLYPHQQVYQSEAG